MELDVPVIGILRGVEGGFFADVMSASFEAGLQAIEITMNTPDAEKIVARRRPMVPPGKLLGMGTVRNLEEARRSVDAGAMFLVTPNLDRAVIDHGLMHRIPVVAGALTPTEVYAAWAAGAWMVKVFPCGAMGGVSYIKALLGPFDGIPLAAVGGVTLENAGDFIEAGARAVGVGSSLFGREALRTKNIQGLAQNVSAFIKRCSISPDCPTHSTTI